jgi:hypothetical protein
MPNIKRKPGVPGFLPIEKTWTTLVSERLTGTDEHINDSIQGGSNEWSWRSVIHRHPEFKENDYVIIQLTAMTRFWFFQDRPHLSNIMNTIFAIGDDVSKEEHKAIELYIKHLHSDERSEITYNAFLAAFLYTAKTLEGSVKFLILPGFHNITGVNGNLADVANLEFDSTQTRNMFYKKSSDNRYNHLTECNHKILADKICNFFENGDTIDLTTGFVESIYNKDNI